MAKAPLFNVQNFLCRLLKQKKKEFLCNYTSTEIEKLYSVFHRFRQAKFDNGDLILSSSQGTLNRGRLGIQLSTSFSGF
jgi:hypothetical protein